MWIIVSGFNETNPNKMTKWLKKFLVKEMRTEDNASMSLEQKVVAPALTLLEEAAQ